MKINKLTIKNYKSIRDVEIQDFRNLNVFIGKNDAGKSNIIGAIDILFNSNLQNYSETLKLVSEDLVESIYEGPLENQFFDEKKNKAEIIAFIDLTKHELEAYGINDEDTELVISKTITNEGNKTSVGINFIRIGREILVKTPDEKKRFQSKKGSYTEKISDGSAKKILEDLENQFILIPADRIVIRDPDIRSEKNRVEQYLKESLIRLANSKDKDRNILFKQFTDFIGKISALIDCVETVKQKQKIVDIKFKTYEGAEIPLSTIGGGNNELLLLLHDMILSGGLILAIEEPEIHLHPEAQRKLYTFMREFSKSTQMFVVTHSPIFVQPDNLRGLFRVVKESYGTTTYEMNKEEYIDKDRLQQELNSENCEMFFADKVLLVEGISDKILMEGLIKKYCKSTDEIKVVTSFSKDNFEIYVQLLEIFKISHVVMTDLDSIKGRMQIKVIWRELKGKSFKNRDERIEFLKKKKIHVLSKGDLERSYPSRYRRHISKPLDALYAIHNLTDEEYESNRMKDLREVIEALER